MVPIDMALAYCNDLSGFLSDIDGGQIEKYVLDGFQKIFGRTVAESEIRSWRNSLTELGAVLQVDIQVSGVGVGIELQIDGTARELGCVGGKLPNSTRCLQAIDC